MSDFTRKKLREIFKSAELEVPSDIIGQICELHTTATDEIAESIDDLKSDLKKVEQERDDLKKKAPEGNGDFISKAEYDKAVKEFKDYKSGIEKEKTAKVKTAAYEEILKKAGVDEKWIPKISKYSGEEIDKLELDENGKAKDLENLIKKAAETHADYVVETHEGGAGTERHDNNNGGKKIDLGNLSMEEYIAARKKEG